MKVQEKTVLAKSSPRRIPRSEKSHSKALLSPHSELFKNPHWSDLIPEDQWVTYFRAIEAVLTQNLRFLIGGGFALANYTNRWRHSRDLDFCVLPSDRDTVIDVLNNAGFSDYYEEKPYDRAWIYRSIRNGVIVDVIWAMPNRRTIVDEEWFTYSTQLRMKDFMLPAVPVEELIWGKLYVMQHDRCDWPDLINLVHCAGHYMNWDRLLRRLGEDYLLMGAVVQTYCWLCPDHAQYLPKSLWKKLRISPPQPGNGCTQGLRRIDLLDTRPWFIPCHIHEEGGATQLQQPEI